MEFQCKKMAQEMVDVALDNATINNIPFREWIDNVNNAYENKKYNLTTCLYNADGKCTNEEKREECVGRYQERYCVRMNDCKIKEWLLTEIRITRNHMEEYAECFDGVPVDNKTRIELCKSHIRFCERVIKQLR